MILVDKFGAGNEIRTHDPHVDIVIDRLLFDGFSPKIIQRILNDSLTGTVDNYANHLKNSVKEITSCSNKKNFSLRASNVKVNKKLLN